MFSIFKSATIHETHAITQTAVDCLVTIDSKQSTRSQIVSACDKLLQCANGLEQYNRYKPLICGSASAWVEKGSVRINKLNN